MKLSEVVAHLQDNPRLDHHDGDPLIRRMDIEDAIVELFDLDYDEDAERIERLSDQVDGMMSR